jgi:hypothetical protein
MITFFYKHRKYVFLTMAVVLIAGAGVGLGSYYVGSASSADSIAKVGGNINISVQEFYAQYNKQEQAFLNHTDNAEIPEAMRTAFKREVLNRMISSRVMEAQAEEYGIHTSDRELAAVVQSNFMYKGQFNEGAYLHYLTQEEKTTPAKFEAGVRAELNSNKFSNLLTTASKVTPQELQIAYLASGKKDLKDFDKEKDQFLQTAVRTKAGSILNYSINSYINAHGGMHDYLDQREQGL